MEQILKDILGRNAFDNDMKIDPDISNMAKTINYLSTQLKTIKVYCDDEGKEYIDGVFFNAGQILKGK